MRFAQIGGGNPRRRPWLTAALSGFVCLLAYADVHVYRNARHALSPHPLGLEAERTEDQIRLNWNPEAPGLSESNDAELIIYDGPHRTQLLLSRAQALSGGLVYTPFTGDVAFHMSAHAASHQPMSEWIRSLAPPDESSDRLRPGAVMHEPGTVVLRGLVAPEGH